jgi:hypothetical protein
MARNRIANLSEDFRDGDELVGEVVELLSALYDGVCINNRH